MAGPKVSITKRFHCILLVVQLVRKSSLFRMMPQVPLSPPGYFSSFWLYLPTQSCLQLALFTVTCRLLAYSLPNWCTCMCITYCQRQSKQAVWWPTGTKSTHIFSTITWYIKPQEHATYLHKSPLLRLESIAHTLFPFQYHITETKIQRPQQPEMKQERA